MAYGTVIVAEVGSTWANNKQHAKEIIRRCKDAGASYAKFQLFAKGSEYDQGGNVFLDLGLFTEFVGYGKELDLPVTASVFYDKALEHLFSLHVPFIKFAHSQRLKTDWIKATVTSGRMAVVSTNVMDLYALNGIGNGSSDGRLVKLFCQPVYPVTWHTNFEGLFPNRFDGYSCHSLGWTEVKRAVNEGATWIEVHVTLPYNDCVATPDGRFALKPDEFKELCKQLRP